MGFARHETVAVGDRLHAAHGRGLVGGDAVSHEHQRLLLVFWNRASFVTKLCFQPLLDMAQ